MQRLRDPQSGCAWDIKQSFESIANYTLEEAYEVVDAIDRADLDDLKDELGDLLFQVVFHAQMASEQSAFDFHDVATAIVEKMIRRHPHVFSDTVFESEQELKASWEAGKAAERRDKQARLAAKGQSLAVANSSALDGIAGNLPALKMADKVQKRAARVGFDWPTIDPVWDKLSEEITEVHEALGAAEHKAVEDEIGDLLFTVVNLARHANVDAEAALRLATRKFGRRFRKVEQAAQANDQTLTALSIEELEHLWESSKQAG